MVDHFSHLLQDKGVGKGDTVIIYMPMIVEAIVGMLACAKLGAVHSVVFGGFAPKELAKRLDDCKPKVVLTASCGIEPNRVIPYLPLVHSAFEHSAHAQASRPTVIVHQRAQVPAVLDASKGEVDWQAEVKKIRGEKRKPTKYAEMDSEDPLYVLYTSGGLEGITVFSAATASLFSELIRWVSAGSLARSHALLRQVPPVSRKVSFVKTAATPLPSNGR